MPDPRLTRPSTWRRAYGSNPAHLLLVLASLALAGYAVSRWLTAPTPVRLLVWFAAAVIGHDLVAAPLYLGFDRWLVRTVGGRTRDGELVPWRRLAVVHLRFALLMSVLLLAMWYPLVLARSDGTYHAASGQHQDRYLGNYLLVVALLFGGSLIAFMIRLARAAGRSRSAASPPRTTSAEPTPAPPAPGTSRP